MYGNPSVNFHPLPQQISQLVLDQTSPVWHYANQQPVLEHKARDPCLSHQAIYTWHGAEWCMPNQL
jgi:hypothetical protein